MDNHGYKNSIFNVVADAPDGPGRSKILYNTASGNLAFIGEEAGRSLEGSDNLCDLIPDSSPDALEMLESLGFLVDDDCDELSDLHSRFKSIQHDDSVLALCIVPTYACNLRCAYCYENGHDSPDSVMDEATQDSIMEFVRELYGRKPFEMIEVQWYGGEPMLAPGVIERLSDKMLSFCEETGLGYKAEIITNASLIGDADARMLAAAGVQGALVTLDGPKDIHNARRPTADGGDSYGRVVQGIENLIDSGIAPVVIMNTDKVNEASYESLSSELEARFGITVKRAKLNDYNRTFGCNGFCHPEFDLFDHAEFAKNEAQRFCAEDHCSEEFGRLLAPIPIFCRGQMQNYYVIDAFGDIYCCDGYVGHEDHRISNLANMEDPADLDSVLEYPFDDPRCRSCAILPLCLGNCRWERESCIDNPCHPLKYTMETYLKGWVKSLESEGKPVPVIEIE